MTKQQEIEQQIKARIDIAYGIGLRGQPCDTKELANDSMAYLHSQGCVLKVEGKLPEHPYRIKDKSYWDEQLPTYKAWVAGQLFLIEEAGYTLTEPLIKEE